MKNVFAVALLMLAVCFAGGDAARVDRRSLNSYPSKNLAASLTSSSSLAASSATTTGGFVKSEAHASSEVDATTLLVVCASPLL